MKKTIKKYLSMCIIAVLMIHNIMFAAIVSDNDGSGFVTKAEFDALKNNYVAQIENYNQSLDEKIGGSIQSYIASKTIKTTEYLQNLSYSTNGITACDTNLDWKEGKIDFGITSPNHWYNAVGATGSAKKEMAVEFFNLSNAANAKPTREVAIKKATYDASNYAEILNYRDVTHRVRFSELKRNNAGVQPHYYTPTGYAYLTGDPNVTYEERISFVVRNLFGHSNVANPKGLHIADVGVRATVATDSSIKYWTSRWEAYAQGYSRIDKVNSIISDTFILTPLTLPYTRFVNSEGLHDWYNDSNVTATRADGSKYHTKLSTTAQLFPSVAGSNIYFLTTYAKVANYKYTGAASGVFTDIDNMYEADVYEPYIGFDTKIFDFNKLYQSKYDKYLGDIKGYCKLTDLFDNKHLPIYAGAPICQMHVGTSLELDMEFADKTKDYDVWLKPTQFYGTTTPWNDSECLDKYMMTVDGVVATDGSMSHSIKIKNGKGKLNIDAQKEGYLFIKFAESGSAGLKGGTLYLPPTIPTYSYVVK